MSDRVGFALIGCGDIGATNALAIQQAPGAQLVRIVDANPNVAAELTQRFQVPVSTRFRDALDDLSVQAVFIATPHDLHADMVLDAATAGKHVIVEKPIAIDRAAASESIAACDTAGVAYSVCHPRRYEDKIMCARKLVMDGAIGRLHLSTSRFLKMKPPEYWTQAPWRGERSRSGGGVIIMNLIHHLDALQVITGQRISDMVGLIDVPSNDGRVEDAAALAVRYEHGAIGTLTASTILPGGKVFEDQIYGDRGRMTIAKRSVHLEAAERRAESPTVFEFEDDAVSKTRFVQDFVQSITTDRPPPVPASYGHDLLQLICGVYRQQSAFSMSRDQPTVNR